MTLLLLSLILAAAPPAAPPAASPTLEQLLAVTPAERLEAPLRDFEREHSRDPEGGRAALVLGRLHYARGDYRRAADAFSRAAARLDPGTKEEARYWAGLCWLGLKDASQARAALEEVAASSTSPRREEARLGVAFAWELAGRPERAFETLQQLVQGSPGEAGPAGLEHLAALASRLQQPELANRARERLLHDYPGSIEAARAALRASRPPSAATSGAVAVEIGEFTIGARATELAAAARRAGFGGAEVIPRGEGRARTYSVRLGVYAEADEARRQGEAAARRLGVTYRLAGPS